ncbi:PaaI family thioesterase [Sphingomonas sp. HF-S3]|uniref:PaaI family thioesterase n=1 Tax=Sphingomonas rustica TaxID=3103142 RepID=A0ABV0B6E7_9SPHN
MKDGLFVYEDDPDAPGWKRYALRESGRFNDFLGPLRIRVEDGVARIRMQPLAQHSNLKDNVHGGVVLGFIDLALFAAARAFEILNGPALTLDLSTQFIGGSRIDEPLEARVELLRETGRLIFLRGLIVQEPEALVASFSGTIRKPSAPAT